MHQEVTKKDAQKLRLQDIRAGARSGPIWVNAIGHGPWRLHRQPYCRVTGLSLAIAI